jgi:divalent metal cation (Fe/Co/Zn/Cd) transporter
MSSPGPLVLGLSLFFGRSSTQLADFIRRTAELIAIIVSYFVYRALHRNDAPCAADKERLERVANLCVGAAMCLSGTAMLFVALFMQSTQSTQNAEKGNVIPGLVIALLGVTTNSWFYLRYRKLNREKPDAILAVQSRLYRAKSLVDACVMLALLGVAFAPGTPTARYMDLGGSMVVAVYLAVNGVITIRNTAARVQK